MFFALSLTIYCKQYYVNNQNKKHLFLKKKNTKFSPHIVYIQRVTGPHRQNDRDDRPCREDHFL